MIPSCNDQYFYISGLYYMMLLYLITSTPDPIDVGLSIEQKTINNWARLGHTIRQRYNPVPSRQHRGYVSRPV